MRNAVQDNTHALTLLVRSADGAAALLRTMRENLPFLSRFAHECHWRMSEEDKELIDRLVDRAEATIHPSVPGLEFVLRLRPGLELELTGAGAIAEALSCAGSDACDAYRKSLGLRRSMLRKRQGKRKAD